MRATVTEAMEALREVYTATAIAVDVMRGYCYWCRPGAPPTLRFLAPPDEPLGLACPVWECERCGAGGRIIHPLGLVYIHMTGDTEEMRTQLMMLASAKRLSEHPEEAPELPADETERARVLREATALALAGPYGDGRPPYSLSEAASWALSTYYSATGTLASVAHVVRSNPGMTAMEATRKTDTFGSFARPGGGRRLVV